MCCQLKLFKITTMCYIFLLLIGCYNVMWVINFRPFLIFRCRAGQLFRGKCCADRATDSEGRIGDERSSGPSETGTTKYGDHEILL